jgi:hypothetical protein
MTQAQKERLTETLSKRVMTDAGVLKAMAEVLKRQNEPELIAASYLVKAAADRVEQRIAAENDFA